MADEITITIDGAEIKTQPGKMVLEAAIDSGPNKRQSKATYRPIADDNVVVISFNLRNSLFIKLPEEHQMEV